ncbi:MAG: hypothetical protein PHV91_01190 [Bacteroidales bacterium]|jgi:hypothetical protein|nr:hypothetical protein [Candidatus Cloacimonadota bacterium]MCB5277888.1 hypothetical protein [Candidatus Cloacimonadota bacterium]MDD3299434.1 hypothetical protein [Bacteroidales bacterium]
MKKISMICLILATWVILCSQILDNAEKYLKNSHLKPFYHTMARQRWGGRIEELKPVNDKGGYSVKVRNTGRANERYKLNICIITYNPDPRAKEPYYRNYMEWHKDVSFLEPSHARDVYFYIPSYRKDPNLTHHVLVDLVEYGYPYTIMDYNFIPY